ncbi:MAG: glycosyltransferase, partial [Acidobacteriota bacterium]|nr:glycosyltransferase [Acidobacteriota bacterium]
MDRPDVSVIIPTYNRADLVIDTVESVLAQTHPSLEIVVIDDGSTDPTREVLAPYHDRIRYVPQANRGLAGARNRGIAEARGRFLAFLDSDDCFEPEMLGAALETFERYPDAGAVFSAETEIDADGNPLDRVFTKKSAGPYFTPVSMIDEDTRVGSGRPPVIQREWVDKLGGFDETIRCAVDVAMWTRYAFHVTMVLQPRPLVLRRIHPANISGNQLQDAKDWLRILDDIRRDHPEFVREHPGVYRRVVAKQQMRYGRELMVANCDDPEALREARR